MSLIQELVSPRLTSDEGSQSATAASAPLVIRAVPVVLRGRELLSAAMQVTLHYEQVHIEGVQDAIPEQVEIDLTPLVAGGSLRIDQLPLPACCEVIGVWFTNPIVTVAARS